ncbi:MAG: 50S ribosomal protein L22 [Cyanobacteriota bacterium]
MESKAKQRYIIMSPRKIRRVINEIRGKGVVEAADILHFMPYAAARVVEKNLHAAVANAEQKYQANPEDLYVSEVWADEGPRYSRFKPRAQGRVYKRIKRTSHLTIAVSIKDKK